ncbi:MAG: antiviral reverse transcriptase Drt3b [Endomicrobiaceae bacterium]
MKRYRQIIRYKKERVVLSDTLPYEIPIIFSNRHFYNFLVENKIEFKNWKVSYNANSVDKALEQIVCLLTNRTNLNKQEYKDNITIPFSYKIQHKENEFRELTICHTLSQMAMVNFYNLYKELIIYYCNISNFSIRKPIKKSKFIYFNDTTHKDKLGDSASVEEQDKEYESLRSFFVYKDYSNVYKFYESNKYLRCEKKYNNLLKLDIGKCFDSIYTHSISWAILTKQFTKEYCLGQNSDFSIIFDKYMEFANYGETHGIIIGPEFSRIFAEIILQSIDRNLYNLLKDCKCYHKKDYEIFRYVDDYFIFYNDESVKKNIVENLQNQLKEYKLSLNTSKSLTLVKPIITDLTIAKFKISAFLDKQIKYKSNHEDNKEYIYINSKECILSIKIILQETKVSYCDIINYIFYHVEKKCESIIKKYDEIQENETKNKKNQREIEIITALWNILDFVFFLYSSYPRIKSSVRLCSVLNIYFSFFKNRQFHGKYLKNYIFKLIYDNIYAIITKNKISANTQLETTYLLIPLVELGKEYLIDEKILIDYLNFEKVGFYKNINYLTIITILFYIKNNIKYKDLKNKIEKIIKFKFKRKNIKIFKDTELILLLFDLLVCPYINPNLKHELLIIYGVKDLNLRKQIIKKRQYWFTQWTNFDFGKAIASKRHQEVY